MGDGPARRYERRTEGLTTATEDAAMATANDTPRVIPIRPPQSALDFARRVITRASDAYDAADQLLAALDDGRVVLSDDDRRCLTMWFIDHAIREASGEFAEQDAAEEAAREDAHESH